MLRKTFVKQVTKLHRAGFMETIKLATMAFPPRLASRKESDSQLKISTICGVRK
jgi:hypothetical protein